MRRNMIRAAIGAGMLGAGIVGAALADSGPQSQIAWTDPVPCYESVSGQLVCDMASPVASPVTEIDTITALPSTGTGPGR